MPTERECVERERKAYMVGTIDQAEATFREQHGSFAGMSRGIRPVWQERCDNRYPLHKVTRPRVVRDPGDENTTRWPGGEKVEWRCVGGELQIGFGGMWTTKQAEWSMTFFRPTPERVRLWADLFANPTEEVEE